MLVVKCENEEIEAVNFKRESIIWKLSRFVDGHAVKPDAIASDKWGNVYIGDGVNNRILKINGLTGNVLNILLLKEKNEIGIHSLFCSDTEDNLTVVRGDKISIYSFPKVD